MTPAAISPSADCPNAMPLRVKPVRLCLATTPSRPTQRRGRQSITDVISPNLKLCANGLGLLVHGLLIPRHAHSCSLAQPETN